jgi:hypothetical protein
MMSERFLRQPVGLGFVLLGCVLAACGGARSAVAAQPVPISIAELKRATPVDFEKEILPVLKNNCLACHNKTKAKADLVLETPADILKGGESGRSVVPFRSQESLLLAAAAHLQEPAMPPRDNKVNAVDLSPAELGLLKL